MNRPKTVLHSLLSAGPKNWGMILSIIAGGVFSFVCIAGRWAVPFLLVAAAILFVIWVGT